jgi:hypothetical protein
MTFDTVVDVTIRYIAKALFFWLSWEPIPPVQKTKQSIST